MKYKIGDIVYLKTDSEQLPRMVTGILIRPQNQIIYYLTLGAQETSHYELEITIDRDILKTIID